MSLHERCRSDLNEKEENFVELWFPCMYQIISGCLFIHPRNHENGAATCSPSGETLYLARDKLWMEITGCDKQLLIFLRTIGLGAKSISGCHTRRVYVIMEKKWCTNPAASKLSFSANFLVNKGCVLYMSASYTQMIRVMIHLKKWFHATTTYF